ncbi:hypothetical protein EJB05_09294, partial [Eragrostis curvula]
RHSGRSPPANRRYSFNFPRAGRRGQTFKGGVTTKETMAMISNSMTDRMERLDGSSSSTIGQWIVDERNPWVIKETSQVMPLILFF